MMGQQVSAAGLAEFAVALFGLVVDANVALTLGDLHRVGFPEAERIDGRSRPTAARRAMTETRRDRLAGHGELNDAAETASLTGLAHVLSFARMRISIARTSDHAGHHIRFGYANSICAVSSEILALRESCDRVDLSFTIN